MPGAVLRFHKMSVERWRHAVRRAMMLLAATLLLCAAVPAGARASAPRALPHDPAQVCSQIPVDSSGSVTWSGQVTLTCDATLAVNDTLNIAAGTTITGPFALTIDGTLTAQGATGQAISFTGGAHLVITSGATLVSLFEVSITGASGAGLSGTLPAGGLAIANSTFSNDGTGISLNLAGQSTEITSSVISNNGAGGISLSNVGSGGVFINFCDFGGNGSYNLSVSPASASVDAEEDWWSTTNQSTIANSVQGSGVYFNNWQTSTDLNAGAGTTALPNASTPTVTVTPTPTGTLPPTATPTVTATPLPVTLVLNPSTVQANTQNLVTVVASGFVAGEQVKVSYVGQLPNGQTVPESVQDTADPTGTIFDGGLSVPASVQPGVYLVTAIGIPSGRLATARLTVQGFSGLPSATSTPIPTLVPTDTPTSTPLPPTATDTPVPTNTPVPTATRVPGKPRITVVGTHVLRLVNGKERDVQQVVQGQYDEFVITYASTPSSRSVTGTLDILKAGKQIGSVVLGPVRYNNHPAFAWILGFTRTAGTGRFTARFHLAMHGGPSVTRNRTFTVAKG
jgi:hypothetical protein